MELNAQSRYSNRKVSLLFFPGMTSTPCHHPQHLIESHSTTTKYIVQLCEIL